MTNDQRIEEWRDVPNYKGYQASNFGQIRTVTRAVGGRYDDRIIIGKVMRQHINSMGYSQVSVRPDGRTVKLLAHRAVALAFLGESKLSVNHKNRIKTDNRLENLEFVSIRANSLHSCRVTKSGFTGVYKRRNTYQAMISIGGKKVNLGYFSTAQDASLAYKNRLSEIEEVIYGTFA